MLTGASDVKITLRKHGPLDVKYLPDKVKTRSVFVSVLTGSVQQRVDGHIGFHSKTVHFW